MGSWSKKSIAQLQSEEGQGHELHCTLSGLHLILLGIGAYTYGYATLGELVAWLIG